MEKKTYIGTTGAGERVFIGWSLKDGKFSASGDYLNAAGTDYNQCGQCIDSIAKDFPKNEQAQDIYKVWKKWHLNDMNAGSSKQTELIENTIGPEYEKLKRLVNEHNEKYRVLKSQILLRLKKARYYTRHTPEYLFGQLINDLKTYVGAKKVRVYWLTEKGVCMGRDVFNDYKRYVRVSSREISLLKSGEDTVPDRYDYICQRLEDFGRYRDPDFIYKGKAYKYGSAYLKKDIPENVVKEIESWVEVQAPDELTPIEKQCNRFKCIVKFVGIVQSPFYKDQRVNEYKLFINFSRYTIKSFKYYQGRDIVTLPEPADIMACILRDARTFEQGIEYLIDDLGYGGAEAVKVFKECEKTYNKLQAVGAYDEELAAQV